jgi:integrase
MTTDATLEPFQQWLERTGYREQTVRATLADVRQVLAWNANGRELPPRLRPSAQRVIDYLDSGGDRVLRAERGIFDMLAEKPQVDPRARRLARRTRRKREARSIGDAEWQRLVARIEHDDSVAGIVLDVLTSTGLRVGDVLRIPRTRLAEAQHTDRVTIEVKGGEDRVLPLDGAPRAWSRLWAAWNAAGVGNLRTVAWLVAPGGDGDTSSKGAAYKAVQRKLATLADEASVTGRVHLHRLRRTVGVQALRISEDVPAVQQLLGHASPQTTLGYLDEARPERVASLQKQINERFTKR